MEEIIKKAIEGGYDDTDEFGRQFKIEKILLDPLFWQALGKVCGWYEYCDNPDHGFIEALKGVKSTDIGRLGCPGCGHDEEHIVPSSRKAPITYALHFHQINLEKGWDSAIKYLEDLLTKERN